MNSLKIVVTDSPKIFVVSEYVRTFLTHFGLMDAVKGSLRVPHPVLRLARVEEEHNHASVLPVHLRHIALHRAPFTLKRSAKCCKVTSSEKRQLLQKNLLLRAAGRGYHGMVAGRPLTGPQFYLRPPWDPAFQYKAPPKCPEMTASLCQAKTLP